jgi:hypothetical protein
LPQQEISHLSTKTSWICDFLLKTAAEMTQRLRLPDRSGTASRDDPKPTPAERKVADSIARELEKEHASHMTSATISLTYHLMTLQVKPFKDGEQYDTSPSPTS